MTTEAHIAWKMQLSYSKEKLVVMIRSERTCEVRTKVMDYSLSNSTSDSRGIPTGDHDG